MRDTLANILGAEWIWLERWQGRSPRALPEAETFPTGAVAGIEMGGVEHDQMLFIEALTPQRLGEELSYINQKGQRYSYPLSHQLVHVVNHSSYHRGQVITLLRQTRRRNHEHGLPRVFRREAKISTVKLSGISTQMNVVPGSTTNFCGSFGLPTRCRYFAAIA